MSFTVFIVDDDPGALKALSRRLGVRGYETRPFLSSREFLATHDPQIPGCAVLDFAMPDLDGLQLQEALAETGSSRPIIFLTGMGDIPTTVRAIKAGAIDFLTKPVDDDALLAALERAKATDVELRRVLSEKAELEAKLSSLTPREREVLTHVVAGRLNKQIAGDLGTVVQTIKVHRSRVKDKLGARSFHELLGLMAKIGK